MIKNHSGRHGTGTLQGVVAEVQGDERGEIRNGYPANVYLPRDPGRRARLLQVLGIWNKQQEEDVTTTEYEEAKHAEHTSERLPAEQDPGVH
jgi:hypothetical protein